MSLPPDILARPTAEAVRLIALGQLAGLSAAAERLADAGDTEALHDARVALRRLRSTLRAWRAPLRGGVRRRHRRALGDLQEATGAGRDAEVGAAWLREAGARLPRGHRTAAAWLAERLERQAQKGRREAREAFARALARTGPGLERGLRTYPAAVGEPLGAPRAAFAPDLAAALAAQAESLERALDLVAGPEDAAAAHAARIQGKRLRYLLEPLAEVLPGAGPALTRLKALQDLLGGLQDLVALGARLDRAVEEAAVEHVRRAAEAARRGEAPRGGRDALRPGLLALARHLAEQRAEQVGQVRARWQGTGAERAAFREALGAVVAAAAAGAPPVGAPAAGVSAAGHADDLEIERKYLLSAVPDPLPAGEVLEVEQGWLPGRRLMERLRRTRRGPQVQLVRSVKLGRGLARVEVEEPAEPALFEALWPHTQGCRVTKRRHRIVDGERVWEIDVFLDRDLVLAEVELPSTDAAAPLPAWLAPYVVREVTEEDAYVNRNLAR